MNANKKHITISIVSHRHGELLMDLLKQLAKYSSNIDKVVIVQNIYDKTYIQPKDIPFNIINLNNKKKLGFGQNHNQAFQYCDTEYFCILNPDIKLTEDPFVSLLECITLEDIDVISPAVVNLEGVLEDNARHFPTPWRLVKKILRISKGTHKELEGDIIFPDWIAGMFLLIRSDVFEKLSGFDQSYFLYYEDVDLCLRAWKYKYKVALYKKSVVIHDARRTSHKNVKYLIWHIMSVIRFFCKHLGRFPVKNQKCI